MAQGSPDGVATNKQLTAADTQSLIAMKYYIDAQLKSMGEVPPQQPNDTHIQAVVKDDQSEDPPTEPSDPDEPRQMIIESESSAGGSPTEKGTNTSNDNIEKPLENTVIEVPELPEESYKTIEEDFVMPTNESPETIEEIVGPVQKVATHLEEVANPLDEYTTPIEKNIESTENTEQVLVAGPVETPDSVGLKTPETTSFETLEVEKDILPKEAIDAAEINEDLEMSG